MEQGRLFDPDKVNTSQFSSIEQRTPFQGAAGRYMQEQGLGEYKPVPADRQVNPQRGRAQFEAYRDAQNKPESPTIRKSYEALRRDTLNQFEFMTRPEDQGGMGMTFGVTEKDPYGIAKENPDGTFSPGNTVEDSDNARRALERDIVDNKHINVLSTKSTGGHEFFTDEENDKFRAVHDVFGHIAVGGSFSPSGEEAAWESHRQMFSPEAREAMTSETRGQNSYLNYGGGDFPEQGPGSKLVGLPEWASETGSLPAAAPNKSRNKSRQLRLFR